ncbi:hypothetical protein [Streptomyces sp. ALI-76-A]|jgi:malate dehydrogenase (oxaloacetate-decarboxylating)|uniref:hypothetical protein n=1 Tax=Streptomyces sp. ALI-76-A TaxID=3025736 RepID=UPI00256F5945|nr:hypothetical protein [Streptomyces sp. ALI-76-A]MDL5199320.1 hypothetical protein [Streptomyces sp. ALI-76-A]
MRDTSTAVAMAVVRAAAEDGVTRETADDDTIGQRVRAAMWQPGYPSVAAV